MAPRLNDTKPRYRQVRSDFFNHPKTRGLSPVARAIWLQAVLSNIAGVLERSVRKLAATTATTPLEVERSLTELEGRGVARWWPDLEVLWVVEAADEQANGVKAWKAVATTIAPFDRQVVRAFHERYNDRLGPGPVDTPSDRVCDTPSDRVCDTPFSQGGIPPGTGNRVQGTGEGGVGETEPPPSDDPDDPDPASSLRDDGGDAAILLPVKVESLASPSPPPPVPVSSPKVSTPHEGAAARVLARGAAAREGKAPKPGRRLRWQREGGRKTGALLFSSDPARVAPGPWVMPAAVESLVAPYASAAIPRHEHAPPPSLPDTEDVGTLCEAMLVGFRAVYRRRTGRAYSGQVGPKRRRSVAESAGYLRDAGISAWVWYDWAWANEVGRRDVRPSLYSLSAPKLVDRLLDRCRSEASYHRGLHPASPCAAELVRRRRAAVDTIRLRRVRDVELAATVIAATLNPEGGPTWDELLERAHVEARTAAKRDEIALRRGAWLWPA